MPLNHYLNLIGLKPNFDLKELKLPEYNVFDCAMNDKEKVIKYHSKATNWLLATKTVSDTTTFEYTHHGKTHFSDIARRIFERNLKNT